MSTFREGTPRQHRRGLGFAVIGLGVGLFLVLQLASLSQLGTAVDGIRQAQTDRAPVLASTATAAHEAARTARLIKSCVTPEGACHKRGLRQQGAAVASISASTNASIIAAAACGAVSPIRAGESQSQYVDRLTACVVTQLAHRR